MFAHNHLGTVRFWHGDWPGALSDLETAVGEAPEGTFQDGHMPSALLLAQACAGVPDVVASLREQASRLPPAGQAHPHGTWESIANLTEALALAGQRVEAAELYPRVRAAIDHGLVIAWSLALWQMVAGIAAAAGEQWDTAQEHFDTALRQADDIPHKIAQPEVRRWYARMLLDRDKAGDKEKAGTLLDEAIAMCGTLGMPRHLECVFR